MSDVAPTTPASTAAPTTGGRRHGASVKTLKKVLKKAGLKTTGKKATLTRRAKKARLMRGGEAKPMEEVVKVSEEMEGARRRGRPSRGYRRI